VVALWSREDGSDVGIFAIQDTESRLISPPLIENLQRRDESFAPAGHFEDRPMTLAAPVLPKDFSEEIVRTAGYPTSPGNIEVITLQLCEMFMVKAQEFINTSNPAASSRFVEGRVAGRPMGIALLQDILTDLGSWGNHEFLPYIQELPVRCRAILLENVERSDTGVWSRMERGHSGAPEVGK